MEKTMKGGYGDFGTALDFCNVMVVMTVYKAEREREEMKLMGEEKKEERSHSTGSSVYSTCLVYQ